MNPKKVAQKKINPEMEKFQREVMAFLVGKEDEEPLKSKFTDLKPGPFYKVLDSVSEQWDKKLPVVEDRLEFVLSYLNQEGKITENTWVNAYSSSINLINTVSERTGLMTDVVHRLLENHGQNIHKLKLFLERLSNASGVLCSILVEHNRRLNETKNPEMAFLHSWNHVANEFLKIKSDRGKYEVFTRGDADRILKISDKLVAFYVDEDLNIVDEYKAVLPKIGVSASPKSRDLCKTLNLPVTVTEKKLTKKKKTTKRRNTSKVVSQSNHISPEKKKVTPSRKLEGSKQLDTKSLWLNNAMRSLGEVFFPLERELNDIAQKNKSLDKDNTNLRERIKKKSIQNERELNEVAQKSKNLENERTNLWKQNEKKALQVNQLNDELADLQSKNNNLDSVNASLRETIKNLEFSHQEDLKKIEEWTAEVDRTEVKSDANAKIRIEKMCHDLEETLNSKGGDVHHQFDIYLREQTDKNRDLLKHAFDAFMRRLANNLNNFAKKLDSK